MRRSMLFLFGLVVLSLCGCGGIQGDNGSLRFELVDAPSHVSSLEVTIQRIDVMIGGDWEIVAFPNQTYDVLAHQTEPAVLGTSGLAEGLYDKIRVAITAARVTDANGTHDVTVPQAVMQDGLEIPVDFEMLSARMTTLLLDFNVAQSLVINPDGSYSLDPVIPTVVKSESGTIGGFVVRNGLGVSGASVKATYTDGPNYPVGTVVNVAHSQADGFFRVWALLPGEYRLRIEADDAFLGPASTTVNNVMVVAENETPLGAVSLD
jgi:hypothetical protein